MLRKKSLKVISLVGLSLSLVGCGSSLTAKVNQKDVDEYNLVVEKTLKGFTDGVTESKLIQEELYEFILTDKLSESLKITTKDTLPVGVIEEFKNNILVDDMYFTSYGASNLREVIIFNSPNNRLIATIIWNTDGSIDSIRRVVVSL